MTVAPQVSTGIEGLDDVLAGGLLRDRLYLVQGDPGVGKTTLGLQFLLAGAKAGEKCLYVTLSETKDELLAVAASHGWSLDGLTLFEMPLGDRVDAEGENTLFHPSEVELAETSRSLLAEVSRIAPSRVVFDSLSEIRLLSQGALRYRRQVLAFKQFFIGRNCTLLLLDDRIADPGDLQLQSLAHGVISLEQLAPLYGAERRRLKVMKMRGLAFRGGYHDFVLRRGGMRVFPRLIAAEHKASFDTGRLVSGVPALDALVGGGLDRGTTMLLLGPAGAGKSTMAIQWAKAAIAAGERAAVFIFDERIGTLLTRARSLGLDLGPDMASGHLDLRQVDPAEMSPGEFTHEVRDAVERGGARLIVIDSLNGYMHAMPQEEFLTLQMHELLSYLAQKGVTTIAVVAQHGLVGTSMDTPVDISYLADSLMLFRHVELGGEVRKAVSMVKRRAGAHEASIHQLTFTARGVALGEPLHGFQGLLTGVPVAVTHGGERR